MINLENYNKTHQYIDCLNISEAIECRDYCRNLVQNSNPEYFPLEYGSPNFLKLIKNDPRSVVLGNYLQYNFFPWNKDSKFVYELLNKFIDNFLVINSKNAKKEKIKNYLLESNERFSENFFVRIAYQQFKNINGFLDIHRDPASTYQIGAPILSLTSKSDVKRGGLFYIKNDVFKNVQKELELGKIIVFNSSWLHGVSNCHTISDYGIEHLLIVVHAFPNSPFNELSTV